MAMIVYFYESVVRSSGNGRSPEINADEIGATSSTAAHLLLVL